MEPQLPAVQTSPEGGVSNPQALPPRPEVSPHPQVEVSSERPAVQEIQSGQMGAGASQLPAVASTPQQAPAKQAAPVLHPMTVHDTNPVIAGDDDVIEKEWVDKAKKIVNATREDPYRQEQEVSKLQADYLKKRYGKEVKLAGE